MTAVQMDLWGGIVAANDPATSFDAAAAVDVANGRMKVGAALYMAGAHGLTDFEHQAINRLVQTSAGKRRLDLMSKVTPPLVQQAVDEDGEPMFRPSTTTGSLATVWTLTADGYRAFANVRLAS